MNKPKIKITLKRTPQAIGDEPYHLAKLVGATSVSAGSTTFWRVGDFLTEDAASALCLVEGYEVTITV